MAHLNGSLDGFVFLNALKDAGVPLHPNTRSVELHVTLEGVPIIHVEIVADADLMHKIASATAAYLVANRLVSS